MNNKNKKFIVDSVLSLTNKYDNILKLLEDNEQAKEYFEEAIAKLEHCLDNL